LEALTVALSRFKGGVVCISHCAEFARRVCNETWMLADGSMTITKDGAKEKPETKEKPEKKEKPGKKK